MKSYAQRMKKPQIANMQQSTAATAQISNQAMLGMLNEPDGDTRFSEALRAKFESNPMPRSERSRSMALAPDVLQKAEERYQTPLAGLKAYEDTGLLDSGYNGYAQGNEIHIDDSLAPTKREEVLMHEIGHVVQRGSGMVHGSGLLEKPQLEQQADQGFVAVPQFTMPLTCDGPVLGARIKSKKASPKRDKGAKRDETMRGESIKRGFIKAKYLANTDRKKQNILLLGEESFLYALALLKSGTVSPERLTATCYQNDLPDTETVKKIRTSYPDVTLLSGIDATNLPKHIKNKELVGNYDSVQFNYPRGSRGNTKSLIDKTIGSVWQALKPGGMFHLTIPKKKTYDSSATKHKMYGTHVKRRVENGNFLFLEQQSDPQKRFGTHGYEHRMNGRGTARKDLHGKEYVFAKVDEETRKLLSKETCMKKSYQFNDDDE